MGAGVAVVVVLVAAVLVAGATVLVVLLVVVVLVVGAIVLLVLLVVVVLVVGAIVLVVLVVVVVLVAGVVVLLVVVVLVVGAVVLVADVLVVVVVPGGAIEIENGLPGPEISAESSGPVSHPKESPQVRLGSVTVPVNVTPVASASAGALVLNPSDSGVAV